MEGRIGNRDIRRQALAAALAEFARRGGFQLVAEGIETEAELETLRNLGPMMGPGVFLLEAETTSRIFSGPCSRLPGAD